METTQLNITQLISTSINSLISNLFSSIDENIYTVLDKITFVNSNIITDSFFKSIYGTPTSIGILLIANSLLVGLIIFYSIRLFTANFVSSQVEQPFQFLFKSIVLGIIMNFSYYICVHVLDFNSLLTLAIQEVGENIFGLEITFNELINKINAINMLYEFSFDIFSFNGLLKSFISFALINLLFSYSLRYVMIKVFFLTTPFAILSLINNSTAWFFKSWLKGVLSLLLLQILIAIILMIIFSINFFTNDSISKILYVGSMYALIKSNAFVKEILGGISTECSVNLSNFKKNIL